MDGYEERTIGVLFINTMKEVECFKCHSVIKEGMFTGSTHSRFIHHRDCIGRDRMYCVKCAKEILDRFLKGEIISENLEETTGRW